MKILAFAILHQGKPYLRAAIESIIDQVDHVAILYSATPSQGFTADIPCPDTKEELIAEAFSIPGTEGKITWINGKWANESQHTDAIWPYAVENGFDWIWRFDADEVSPPHMIGEMIRQAEQTEHKTYRVPFVHLWRSFSRVCRDGQNPMRLARVDGGEGTRNLEDFDGKTHVFHFGYAQPTKYIEYKMQVSGHRPEWRPDWFETRWLANAQADVHPVNYPTHWMPEDFDKETLPDVLRRHPYFRMAVIE